jgi:hypothetical protein
VRSRVAHVLPWLILVGNFVHLLILLL